MVAADRLRLVPAHLPRRHAAGVLIPPDPVDDRAHRNAELGRRPMPRQAARQHRRNDTLAKINRIRFSHLMLTPLPASTLNHNKSDSGPPMRFKPKSPRSSASTGGSPSTR